MKYKNGDTVPIRIPVAKPTLTFKDKKKYNRKQKHRSHSSIGQQQSPYKRPTQVQILLGLPIYNLYKDGYNGY